MLYWLPGDRRVVGAAVLGELPPQSQGGPPNVTVPTGCSIFPKEIFRSSRRWAEKRFTKLDPLERAAEGRPLRGVRAARGVRERAARVLPAHAGREMSATAEQREFAEYARRWLDENAPPPPPERLPGAADRGRAAGRSATTCATGSSDAMTAGLVGADLPVEYGGGGHTGFQRIANQRDERAPARRSC